jgi:hypothetical protein
MAFRKYHSTTHALIAMTDYIYKCLDGGEVCIFVALDIRKAFDKCSKEVLIHKLEWYGVSCKIIESFLSERSQFVSVNCNNCSNYSEVLTTNLGVPQGLCVSCLLFLVMMNDLPCHVKNSLCAMFADDTGILISGPIEYLDNVILKLESDLNVIYNWMCSNRLELNVDKCEFMVIANKKIRNSVQNVSIKINNVPLLKVHCVKVLGVLIDDQLMFRKHCKSIVKKCYNALWSLGTLKKVIDIKSRIIVVQSLVKSIYNYAAPVWLVGSNNIKCIDRVIRDCARFIFIKAKFDSISDNINVDLEWLTAKNICNFEMSKLAFKMINECGPKYFNNYICLGTKCIRDTRNSSYLEPDLVFKSKIGQKCFMYRASKLWLDLPKSITSVYKNISFNVFKDLTKTHFIGVQSTERMIQLFELIDEYESHDSV